MPNVENWRADTELESTSVKISAFSDAFQLHGQGYSDVGAD